jgi:hypothetical protein
MLKCKLTMLIMLKMGAYTLLRYSTCLDRFQQVATKLSGGNCHITIGR